MEEWSNIKELEDLVLKGMFGTKNRSKLLLLIADVKKDFDILDRAYGGCHKCYGKGYHTFRYATTALGDFEGEKDVTSDFEVHMNFCICDRGRQLKELFEK